MNLLSALLLGVLATPAEDPKPPRLHVEATEIDFGTLFQGEATARTFRFENHGGAPLVVDQIKPTCGCVAARIFVGEERREVGLDKSALIGGTPIFVLAPGEGADLEVVYDATGQPPLPQGHTKKILVGTNDPDRRRTTLVLRVMVKLALEVHPRQVRFGELLRGVPAAKDVLVKVADGLDLRVTSVENAGDAFEAAVDELEPTDAVPERRYRLHVEVRKDAALGAHSRMVSLLTDHPTLRRVNVPVSAFVRSAVRFDTGNPTNDSTLAFGWLPRGERTTRAVEVVNTDPSVPYSVLGLDVDVDERWKDGIEVELREVEPGVRYRILVTAKANLTARFFKGTLTVRADHADEPAKVLQFNGRVRPEGRNG